MTNVSVEKLQLRKAALARRLDLPQAARDAAALALSRRPFPAFIGAGMVVSGYMPIRGEIDPRPLMLALESQAAILALPTISADNQPLIFRIWREGDAMQRGALGIHEPNQDAAIVVPDIVLVPLAAFDRRGHRIGYGAGHYDRSLAALRPGKPACAIGLAFAVQEIPRVPNEPHDVPLDLVLTETETIDLRSG